MRRANDSRARIRGANVLATPREDAKKPEQDLTQDDAVDLDAILMRGASKPRRRVLGRSTHVGFSESALPPARDDP